MEAVTEEKGRARQKARTRQELLQAAQRLMERGEPATPAGAADEAGVSRATAYRYFPSAEALTLEAALDGVAFSPEAAVGSETEPRARAHAVRRRFAQLVHEAEPQFRLYLARTLDAWVAGGAGAARKLRGGRRLAAYAHALEPARGRMTPETFDFLVWSLSAVSGVEAMVALEDSCGLDRETAERVAASNLDAILDRLLPPAGEGA